MHINNNPITTISHSFQSPQQRKRHFVFLVKNTEKEERGENENVKETVQTKIKEEEEREKKRLRRVAACDKEQRIRSEADDIDEGQLLEITAFHN